MNFSPRFSGESGTPFLPPPPGFRALHTEGTPSLGFRDALRVAFLVPWRGEGLRWMLLIGAMTLLALFALFGSVFLPFFGWLFRLAVLASLLTLNTRFFFSSFQAALEGDAEALAPLTAEDFRENTLIPGLVLLGWVLTMYLPLYLWMRGNSSSLLFFSGQVVFFVLALLPFLFWPISLIRMTGGKILEMWNLPASILAILRVPGSYAVVILFGSLAGLLPLVVSRYVFSARLGFVVSFLSLFLACLSMAYAHGVMGILMGALASEHPEILPQGAQAEE